MKQFFLFVLLFAIMSCSQNRNSVSINGDKLYFDGSVSSQEAMRVLQWMQKINHNWGSPREDFHLSKKSNYYLFQYPVQIKDAEKQDGNIGYIQTFADRLSADALNGQEVVVRLTDDDWKKEKKLVRSATTIP